MRKILLVVTILLVFLLSSCRFVMDLLGGRVDTVESIYYENYYDYEDNGYVDVYFFEKEEVPYMEINRFFELVSTEAKTDEIEVVSTERTLTLSYDFAVGDASYPLIFSYDYDTMIATVNHIEYFDFLERYTFYDEYYHSYLQGFDVTFSDPVSFDLGKYGLEFRKEDGKDFVELDLGNLFFASQFSQLYFTGSALYKVYFEDFDLSYLDSYYFDLGFPEELRTFALQFYAFYFDYFYGLNIDQDEGYYYQYFLEEHGDITTGSTQEFYQGFDYLIKDFDDLHLWLYFEGYYNDSYDFDDASYIYSGRTLINKEAEERFMDYCETNYSGVYDDVLFLEVDSLANYNPEIIAMDLNKFYRDDIVDVVFDFTCNPGGYVYYLHDMIGFFTDDIYEFYEYNFKYDSSRKIVFDSDIQQIQANLYVLVSGYTYSAANVLAAYVQANDYATVIGENTNGGSSTTEFVLGPGGMVVNGDSFVHFTDQNNTYYEYGVTVDYVVQPEDTNGVLELLYLLRNE